MAPLPPLLILLALLSAVSSYLLDESNYFYINSSYSRQTISLSICFKLSESAQIQLASDILIPQGSHRTTGIIDNDNKEIVFDPPFDRQMVDYNSYDDRQHWFGIKISYPNPEKYQFLTLAMNFSQGQNRIPFFFMLPLFSFPISALPIAPNNSLASCQDKLLVSTVHKMGELDVTVFGANGTFKIEERQDWGFFKADSTSSYLRFKSKKADGVTIKGKIDNSSIVCRIDPEALLSLSTFEGIQIGYTLAGVIGRLSRVSEQL